MRFPLSALDQLRRALCPLSAGIEEAGSVDASGGAGRATESPARLMCT